jgi:hypothetical protein
VTRHQNAPALCREPGELRALDDRRGERLLDERVLARLERGARELEVGPDRGRDDDRLHLRVGQNVREAGRLADPRVAACDAVERLAPRVADKRELGGRRLVEVADEVRAPVAEADDRDPDGLVPAVRERVLQRVAQCVLR